MRGKVCWEEFKEIFNSKYFLDTYQKERQDEFLYLKQREFTIVEYEKKFTELDKYALMMVAIEKERCRQFEC